MGMADTLIARLSKIREIVGARHFSKARQVSGENSETTSMLGYTSAKAGDHGQARAVLNEMKTLSGQKYIPPHNIAMVHNGLARGKRGFRLVGESRRRSRRSPQLFEDPKWDSLRADRRFADILRRIGL